MKSKIVLPEINNTKSDITDIMKNTKNFIKSKNSYHSFLRSSYLENREKVKSMINLSSTPLFTSPGKQESTSNFCETEGVFTTNPSAYSSVKNIRKIRKSFIREQIVEADFFTPNFFEFLNENGSINSTTLCDVENADECCVTLLEQMKEKGCKHPPKLKKVFNRDVENDRIHINLKSYKLDIRHELFDELEGLKLYLPLDIAVVFAFLTSDEIIFLLSQAIQLSEEKKIVRLNTDSLRAFLNKTKFFGGFGRKVSTQNKFKVDRNIKFKLISETNMYNITLHCPEISFHFLGKNFSIKKHIGLNFLLKNIKDSFTNWEAMVLESFREDKDFRSHFNKVISKCSPYEYTPEKVYLNIDKRFKKNNETYTLDATSFPFIIKFKGVMRFINIFGYTLETKTPDKLIKYLNWRITFIFLQLRNILNVDYWINRRTRMAKNGEIIYDKNWINELDNKVIQFYCKTNEDINNIKRAFIVKEPKIVIQSFNDSKYNIATIDIRNEFLIALSSRRDIPSFVDYINKHILDLITPAKVVESK
jgi:hypothetical protein